jgi:hypothetical protein
MHVSEYVSAERSGLKDRVWFHYAVAALMGLFLVCIDRLDGYNYFWDVDDVLRLLQIKNLQETGNWFDRTLPFIEMPEAYISPWSRLVDLPYIFITWLLMPFMAAPDALNVASFVWPPVMLVVFCILFVAIQKRIVAAGEDLAISSLILSFFLMPLAIWQFSPGRVDHHNMQLVLCLLLFFGLVLWSCIGGFVAALAIVLSVAVGLEVLPQIAFVLAAVCLSWAFNQYGANKFLYSLGAGIILFTPLAAISLLGPTGMSQTACDAFSAPYIFALMGFGFIAVVMPLLQSKAGAGARILSLGLSGAILLVILAAAFPLCLSGPYHMIDPISRELWLNRVTQEQSILSFFTMGDFFGILTLAAGLIISLIVMPLVWKQYKKGFIGIFIIFLLSFLCLLFSFFQTRYKVFPIAFIPLFFPMLMSYFNKLPRADFVLQAVIISFVSVLGFGLHFAFPVKSAKLDVVDYVTYFPCVDADISALNNIPPGRIMTPATVGLFIADRLPPGMKIAGITFHRASPGMKRIWETFILPDAVARKAALQPFDYMAVCRSDLPESIPSTTLFAKLTRGEKWPGLDVIETPATSGLRLFKIDHARLQ